MILHTKVSISNTHLEALDIKSPELFVDLAIRLDSIIAVHQYIPDETDEIDPYLCWIFTEERSFLIKTPYKIISDALGNKCHI